MMSGNQITMSRSIKRKIIIDGESSSQGTTKKHAQCCRGTALSYTEETEEEIKIVFESIAIDSEEKCSEEKCSEEKGLKLDTSKYKNEFFKHYFLPSMRKRNNRYTRNDSRKSNLRDVGSCLLDSGTALSDPGDIMQVSEYAASKTEIECYQRILAGGSSRKLISRRDEQNLKKKYSQHKLCVVDPPIDPLSPPVFIVITEDHNVPNDSEIKIVTVGGDVNFLDDCCDSSSVSMSEKSENSHKCSVINNRENRQDVLLSSDKFPLNSINFNYDSMRNITNCNLQHNASESVHSPDYSPVSDDEMQNGVINEAKAAATDKAYTISSDLCTDITANYVNEITVPFDELQKALDTIKNMCDSNKSSQNERESVDNNAQYFLNSIVNSCVTNESTSALTNLSSSCTTDYLNEINVPYEELQKVVDTIKNMCDSNKSSQNERESVDNNAQYFLNSIVNSCVTNESTSALTNLSSSCTTDYLNEINVPYEELQKAVDTIKKVFDSNVGCQNEVSVDNNAQHFINAGSEEHVGIETIKSPSPFAAEENSDDEYEDFEPFYNNTDIESSEDNSLVSSDRNSSLSTEDVEEHRFVATENVNLLADKEDNNFSLYITDKGMEIEKCKYDGFAYGITDSEANSCDFNESFTRNEKFFCKNNSKKEELTEISKKKAPSKDNCSKEIDDLTLLGPEKLTENSTPKETMEATNDSNGKEINDLNVIESEKLIENSISKETVENAKSPENKMSQSFYGNRVSNRGTFLTQKIPINPPPKPKNLKRKTFEVNRNLFNTNPEELHALIKTPDINIDLSRLHSHANRHKCMNSSRNRLYKSSGISSNSDQRPGSLEDKQNTPMNSPCQVYTGNNVTNQNTGFLQAPASTHSPVLISNNMPLQGTILNTFVASTNFMPSTITHLNSLSASSDHRTSVYDVNRYPGFPLAIYPIQHPFQPYVGARIPPPINPFQLQSYTHPRFLSPVHPPQLPFQTYGDARIQAGSFMFNNSFDSASEILESNNEGSNNYTPPKNIACTHSQSTVVIMPPNMPSDTPIPVASSFANDVSSKSLDKETEASEITQVSNRNRFLKTSSNSRISSSPSFVVHTDEMSGKPKCLVPTDLKCHIGSKIFKTEDVRLLILEWNVDSIFHDQNNQQSYNVKNVSNSYGNFEEYYNTFFPLLMIETWQRIYASLKHLTKPFSAEIVTYSKEKDHVIVKCKTVYNAEPDSYPEPGNIVIVNYGTKSNEHTVKIFGYLIQSKLRRFDPEADTETCKSYTHHADADTESYTLPVLAFTFIAAYDSEHINRQLPVRIHVLYALKFNLKQHDALLSVKESPFEKYILKPNSEGLLKCSLNPENSEEEISKCVENVTEKISSPHPSPVIAIIKTNTNSDHLKIIPLLIQRIRNNCSNTKVLVCVRTRGPIADIAAKLSSARDLKFIIVCKRCNISPKFRKFLFEDLVKKKEKDIKRTQVERKVVKEEIIKIKKAILLDSDVVISWAREIHDDFIAQTFSEAKSIDNMCCIIDEAHSFTEPETLIPTLYGISKLILIGNTDGKSKILCKKAAEYGFDNSYFHRAYDPDTSPD